MCDVRRAPCAASAPAHPAQRLALGTTWPASLGTVDFLPACGCQIQSNVLSVALLTHRRPWVVFAPMLYAHDGHSILAPDSSLDCSIPLVPVVVTLPLSGVSTSDSPSIGLA